MIKIAEFGLQTAAAVDGLIRGGHYIQALVVLYSAIDTLAWSTRTSEDVTESDFCRWVAQYMQPDKRLGCTPKDLYAARCGLVHSGAAESRMSRRGSATEIWYATASKSVSVLQAKVARPNGTAKVVCLTDLYAAVVDGAVAYSKDLESDIERQRRVADRIGRWLSFVPMAPVLDSWGHAESSEPPGSLKTYADSEDAGCGEGPRAKSDHL